MVKGQNGRCSSHILVIILRALSISKRRFIMLQALALPPLELLLLTVGLGFRGDLSSLALVHYFNDMAALILLDDTGLEHLLHHQLVVLQLLPF